ncbi:restriction endonuclease subunit S [Coprococcus sp. OM04-5BH]|uniref:restriction endonuclease subunit S n=1 Tax=Coprococcus sp. OM04-5BH TaxID=2293093 RepID=UPI000E4BA8B1|nr:restriction endonuclease subunit S [Coprococcus sp. OM04-5BH]RHV34656.1 restriction endonuclease subunit S [Coprococcus sp. OM04-5BH]
MAKPKIRFKGYTNDWEQRKLGDIYGSIGNAFVGTATPYYAEHGHFYLESNNVKDGQINHNAEIFINDEFYEKQKDKWLHTGDMVMVQSGHVGHAAVIPEELDNTAAHALIMFRNPKEEIEPYFLNYEYQTDKAKKQIENITTGNTIKHILASDMQEFVVDIPKYEEQKVIASYFCNFDHLITLHQRKCDQAKKLKKYMLQKMFPKNNGSVPEIRFEGFSNDWEQRKLGELYKKSSEKNDGSISMDRNITVATMQFKEDVKVSTEDYLKTYYTFNIGDIAFEGHQSKEYRFGRFVENDIGNGIVSHIFAVFRPIVDYDLQFWKYAINNESLMQRVLSRSTKASTMMHDLVTDDFLEQKFLVPSVKEQERIGMFLSNLDNLITLHQKKCDQLKNLKKFMLQNMFV